MKRPTKEEIQVGYIVLVVIAITIIIATAVIELLTGHIVIGITIAVWSVIVILIIRAIMSKTR